MLAMGLVMGSVACIYCMILCWGCCVFVLGSGLVWSGLEDDIHTYI